MTRATGAVYDRSVPDTRDEGGVPEIPDLDLPKAHGTSANASAPPSHPRGAEPSSAFGGDFGPSFERGPALSSPPVTSQRPPAQQIAIQIGGDDDDFGLEIERGGALVSMPPASSMRPAGPASARPAPAGSGRPAPLSGSGLELAYKRSDLERRAPVDEGPSAKEKALAWVVTTVAFAGTGALLVKLAHQAGGRSIIAMLPHAFDATSTVQSGAVSLVALVLTIAIGFIGVRARPRSWAMLGSAVMILLASLAMVTVTLVSTEENPAPPDGALLIPYVVPAALVLLGLGVARRGVVLFLDGGVRRAAAFFVAAAGGALVFAGIELSALARFLPG